MDVGQRVTSLLEGEHAQLREAVVNADKALGELEEGVRQWVEPERVRTPAPADRRYGTQPSAAPMPELARRPRSTTALREAWTSFRARLDPHMRRERDLVLPLCAKVARGDDQHRIALRTTITQMNGEHDELRHLLVGLRREARTAYPVRNEFERVARLFDAHTRIEEVDIYPAFFVEEYEVDPATPIPVSTRTSDDIARALRSRSRSEPEPEPEPEAPGMLGRLKRFWAK